MNLEIGQMLYGCGYKTRMVSFCEDLIVGMKLLKPKIKGLTDKYIILGLGRDKQIISKQRLGKSIFLTKLEAVNFIIEETQRRLNEKADAKRSQHMDTEHIEELEKDLKKWKKFRKCVEDVA